MHERNSKMHAGHGSSTGFKKHINHEQYIEKRQANIFGLTLRMSHVNDITTESICRMAEGNKRFLGGQELAGIGRSARSAMQNPSATQR